jgi:membrane protease YdiL (CAAX protease family)
MTHLSVLLFAMCFPSFMAWIYFIYLAKPTAGGAASYLALSTYAASKAVQFGFPLIWVLGIERRRIALPRLDVRGLSFGAVSGLMILALALGVYFGFLRGSSILAATPEKVLSRLRLFHAETPLLYILLALFLSAVHSLMEEYYWRWFVFGEMKRIIAPATAGLVSSFGFMGHHVILLWVYFPDQFWTGAVPFSICIAIGGAIWAWLYQRMGTIYASWLSHLLTDAAIMAIGFDMIFVLKQ